MSKKNNPLFYLGWLGLIGVLGCVFPAPWMMSFLLFFFFFRYKNMTPDEMFWKNIEKAGVRAFAVYVSFTGISLLMMFVRATFIYKFTLGDYKQQVDGRWLLTGHAYEQLLIGIALQVLILIATLSTFFFLLMYYRRKEKKYVEAEECLEQN